MPAPDMRAHMEGLKDRTLRTPVDQERNIIVGFRGSKVLVATDGKPEGAEVSISLVQNAVNDIFGGKVHVLNRNNRSAFLAAVLGTLVEVEVNTEGTWTARLRSGSPQLAAERLVFEALQVHGGQATRQEVISWAVEHGDFTARQRASRGDEPSEASEGIADALNRARERGTIERPERGEYRTPEAAPGPEAGGNPDWTFDELILALDLYLKWRTRTPKQPPPGEPDLVALSDLLHRLPIHPLDARKNDFRNVNSVRRKLGDYTSPDPTDHGKGTKGGTGVHLVWGQFADDPAALAAAVERITASADEPSLPPPDEDEAAAVEGRILVREHRYRERDRTLVAAKKAATKEANGGRLPCEACAVDLVQTSGALADGFIEAHHDVPLATGGERTTVATDLSLLCANCHRMVHKARPMLTVEQLRERIADAAS